MRNQPLFLARLWALESAVIEAGLPPMPAWWRREVERFYLSGKQRWVIRKGRRVFASTCVAPRLAVAEMLFGEHVHLPGTPSLIYAFLSVQRGESAERLSGVTAILDILGVAHSVAGTTVRLRDYPAVFKIITANHRASVGGTCAFAWCDEVSRWNDDKLSKNPAEQVVTSLSPALATLPDARLFLVSSPLSTKDFHAREFDDGETGGRCVSFGETWTINPTLSEERTHELEPSLRAWTREYAAIPVDGVEEDWFGAAVELAFAEHEGPELGVRNGMRPIFTIDPAFAHDYFGWSVVTTEPAAGGAANDNGRRLTIVHQSGARAPEGEPRQTLEWFRDHVVIPYQHLAGLDDAPRYVHTDQAEFYSLREVAKQLGITLLLVPWTGGTGETSKLTRFRAVRTAMLGSEVRIPRRKELMAQFRSVTSVVTPAGNETIQFMRGTNGHCDELSAVVQGISIALESVPRAAQPLTQPAPADDPRKWREDAIRKVAERRAREMKRSPGAVMKKAMGL